MNQQQTDSVAAPVARKASAGVLWLSLAKFYFMGTGMVLMLILPSLFARFGGEDHVRLYGEYRLVMTLVNWFNMVLIGGTLQAVSKFISERNERAASVRNSALLLQTVIGGASFIILFAFANVIATYLYKDSEIAFYLRLASPIILIYAFYAVFIGCMNGLERFRHQATMDMLFATLKVGLTLGLVAIGMGILGAIVGFLLTAAIMLVLAILLLGRVPKGESVGARTIFAFQWLTLLHAFFLNGLLAIDIQLLEALGSPESALAADPTGLYSAAQQIAQVPYVATVAIAFVIFPLISKSTFEKDTNKTSVYITTTNKYVAIFLTSLVLGMVCESPRLVGVIFPADYASIPFLVNTLSVGYLFFAMMVVNANILTGSGAPAWSVALFGSTLAVSVGLAVLLVPELGAQGSALASAAAMGIGFAGGLVLVWRRFGVAMPWLTPVRVLISAAATWAIAAYLMPDGRGLVWLLVRGMADLVIYYCILIVIREISPREVLRALRRRK